MRLDSLLGCLLMGLRLNFTLYITRIFDSALWCIAPTNLNIVGLTTFAELVESDSRGSVTATFREGICWAYWNRYFFFILARNVHLSGREFQCCHKPPIIG